MELLHSFRPTAFLLQDLKFPVLLIQNGLFGIEHQAIGRTHEDTSMQDRCDSRARYQSIFKRRKPSLLALQGTFGEPAALAALR